MVEKVSGERLESYFHEHIFGPLGMADTSLKLSPSQRERLLAMHARGADGSLKLIEFEMPQEPEFFMAAKTLKMALVPEDRRRQGLVLQHSVETNVELTILARLGRSIFVDSVASRTTTERLIQRLAIKTPGPDAPADSLSGGNQQKIVIGKWLATEPEILIMDEPTAGIDIGSKGEVLRLVRELAAEGKSILFISSELAELIAVSDRIAVMSAGRIVETIDKRSLIEKGVGTDDLDLGAEQRLQWILQRGRAQ
jgi:ribose transport system ATP-binding protein